MAMQSLVACASYLLAAQAATVLEGGMRRDVMPRRGVVGAEGVSGVSGGEGGGIRKLQAIQWVCAGVSAKEVEGGKVEEKEVKEEGVAAEGVAAKVGVVDARMRWALEVRGPAWNPT